MRELATTRTDWQVPTAMSRESGMFKRTCACGNHTMGGAECPQCNAARNASSGLSGWGTPAYEGSIGLVPDRNNASSNSAQDERAITGASIGGIIGGVPGAIIGGAIGYASCTPGQQRSVDLQPVVFRSSAADPTPTGGSWSRRFRLSNTIWNKLGVQLTAASAVTITDPVLKSAGSNRAERDSIRAAHDDASKVCVFLTDNDLADAGGGGTVGGGAAGAKIALSDRGTSNTLLAHELGHVLGLGHPPGDADANTIMEASGSNAADNPTRNTIGNYRRITWPAPGSDTCINPDR